MKKQLLLRQDLVFRCQHLAQVLKAPRVELALRDKHDREKFVDSDEIKVYRSKYITEILLGAHGCVYNENETIFAFICMYGSGCNSFKTTYISSEEHKIAD